MAGLRTSPEVFHARHKASMGAMFRRAEELSLSLVFTLNFERLDEVSESGVVDTAFRVAADDMEDGTRAGFFRDDDGETFGRWMLGADVKALEEAIKVNPDGDRGNLQ